MKPKDIVQFEDLEIDRIKEHLKELKKIYQEAIDSDPDYEGEADLLIETIKSLEESLVGVTHIEKLDKRKQARIFADMTFLETIHTQMAGEDEDFDFEEDEE